MNLQRSLSGGGDKAKTPDARRISEIKKRALGKKKNLLIKKKRRHWGRTED